MTGSAQSPAQRIEWSGGAAVGLAALCALFGIVVALTFDRLTVPVTLYAPVFGEPRHVNIPQLAVVPLAIGIALAGVARLLKNERIDPRIIWQGLTIGVLATLYAGLMRAVELLLGNAYFTTPYRLYALAFLGAASFAGTWWLWRIARRRTLVASPELFSWPLLVTLAVVVVGAAVQRALTPTAVAGLAAVAGGLAAERDLRPRVRVTRGRILLTLLILAFALRAIFGLQLLARTGSGAEFATASDDGPSYYDKAIALYTNVSAAAGGVLAADDGFPPAYSFFLAAVFGVTRGSLAAVVVLQALAAVATAALLYTLGSRLRGPVVGLLAAGIFATDQNVIQDGSTLTPEAILVPTVLLAVWAADCYRRSHGIRWILLAAVAVGLAFITRNIVGGTLAVALAVWLVLLGRTAALRAARDVALIVVAVLVFSAPVVVATARTGSPRLTNQLAGLAYSLEGHQDMTVENTFLLQRGIDPFKDGAGSVQRVLADPLPVIGFLAGAAPQRIMTLLFYAPSGSADPIAIVTPTQYPNPYGQPLVLLSVVGLVIAAVAVLRRPPWKVAPLAGVLLLYALLYVAIFAFLFPPDHPFRYRIPIEPVSWLAEAIGLVVLVRAATRTWISTVDDRP